MFNTFCYRGQLNSGDRRAKLYGSGKICSYSELLRSKLYTIRAIFKLAQLGIDTIIANFLVCVFLLVKALTAAHTAGISVTQWAILRFFDPQGRHVAPMG